MMKLNYKGFTLVELLAVIAIMGMLAVIMVPTISGVIEENKKNNSENLKNSIKSSARAYISDNRYQLIKKYLQQKIIILKSIYGEG